MRVFIAGASGVLGRATIRELCVRGHDVVGLVRSEERVPAVQELGAEPVIADMFDVESLHRATDGCDVVMHLATAIPKKGFTLPADWAMNDRMRREGTRNLVMATQGRPLQAFILQSIAFLYGDRHGDWVSEDEKPRPSRRLQSAIDAERAALGAFEESGLPAVVLRGATFYGPEAWHTQRMMNDIKHRRYPIIGAGDQYWHYVHVRDMAQAFACAAESPVPGETFFVADDWPFHARDLINYLAAQLHAPAPYSMSVTMANVLSGGQAGMLANSVRYRNHKIKKLLGWQPRYPTYRDGFAEILPAARPGDYRGL